MNTYSVYRNCRFFMNENDVAKHRLNAQMDSFVHIIPNQSH